LESSAIEKMATPRKEMTPDKKDAIFRLHQSGMSKKEISDSFGDQLFNSFEVLEAISTTKFCGKRSEKWTTKKDG
jgi:hypothetical protein